MQSGLSLLSSFGLLLLCIRTYHVSSFFIFNFPSIICNDYHNSKLILQSTYSTDTTTTTNESSNKRIVLIRHGCTYMNEYLSIPGSRWGDPNFTDVFPILRILQSIEIHLFQTEVYFRLKVYRLDWVKRIVKSLKR